MVKLVGVQREHQGIFWGVSGLGIGGIECIKIYVKQTGNIRMLYQFQGLGAWVASATVGNHWLRWTCI